MATKKSGERTERRQYTDDEKAAAVADANAIGVCAAAKKHAIHQTNVSRWKNAAKPAGLEAVASANDVSASAVTRGEPAKKASEPVDTSKPAEKSESESVDEGTPAPTTKRSRRAKKKARSAARKEKRRPARKYTPSERAQILETAAKKSVTEAAEEHDVSRFSIYDWQRKLTKAAAGEGPSPTSGPAPKDIEQQRDAEILEEWKTHPGLGPSQIRNQLRRKNIKVAVQTVRRVMEDAGYRPPKVVRQKHDRRFEAVRPNHLWHFDFVQRYIGKTSTFTLILIDDCSRYVVGHGVDDAERADMVVHTFEEATNKHGRPERVMTDKGSAFWSWRGISRFTALLTEMGIDPIVAEHKEWNGKVEAFNGNLHKELFDAHRFYDVAEMRRRLETHVHWYNHARTHHALGGLLVPADRYYGRAAEPERCASRSLCLRRPSSRSSRRPRCRAVRRTSSSTCSSRSCRRSCGRGAARHVAPS